MSTSYSWEGIRQVRATLLGARHVPERLCGGYVYLGRYIKCSTFTFYLFYLYMHHSIIRREGMSIWFYGILSTQIAAICLNVGSS